MSCAGSWARGALGLSGSWPSRAAAQSLPARASASGWTYPTCRPSSSSSTWRTSSARWVGSSCSCLCRLTAHTAAASMLTATASNGPCTAPPRRPLVRAAVCRAAPGGSLQVLILRKLRGTLNVVHMAAAYEDETHVHIVMEYCRGGELFHRMGRRHYSEQTVSGNERVTQVAKERVRAASESCTCSCTQFAWEQGDEFACCCHHMRGIVRARHQGLGPPMTHAATTGGERTLSHIECAAAVVCCPVGCKLHACSAAYVGAVPCAPHPAQGREARQLHAAYRSRGLTPEGHRYAACCRWLARDVFPGSCRCVESFCGCLLVPSGRLGVIAPVWHSSANA